MHLPDAYISPAVALAFCAGAILLALRASARVARSEALDRRVPLMAGMAAFAFAMGMMRFPIAGTAACGHLTGGLLAAIILGPDAAFLVLFAVQIIQAIAFSDGGLLALGVNVVNAALWPAWVGRPIYRRLAPEGAGPARTVFAAVAAALVSIEMGALVMAVAVRSGLPDLSATRLLGIVAATQSPVAILEGLVTAALLLAGRRLLGDGTDRSIERAGGTGVLVVLGLSLFGAAVLADFSSARPEWPSGSLAQSHRLPDSPPPIVQQTIALQQRIALLPGYGEGAGANAVLGQASTSVAGFFGSVAAALLALAPGFAIAWVRRLLRRTAPSAAQESSFGAGGPCARGE